MALADFNKSNPFIIQLRTESERFDNEIFSLSKSLIVLFALFLPTLVLTYFGFNWRIIELAYLTSPIIINFSMTLYIMRSSESKKINDILYGNVYKNIFANNEELNNLNCLIRELLGRIKVLKEITIINNIIYLILDAISILILFAKLLHF